MPTRSTIRYAAKAAYQLSLMTGRCESYQCGLHCKVFTGTSGREVTVTEYEGRAAEHNVSHQVPIAKAWVNL